MEPTDSNQTEELRQSLEETRKLNQQRVRERKKKRRLQAMKTVALVMAISVLLCAAGLLIYRVIEREPMHTLPPSEQTEPTPAQPTGKEQPMPQEPTETEKRTPVELEAKPMQPETPEEPEVQEAPEEPAEWSAPAEPKILDLELYSESAILIDRETGAVLAEKNPDAKIYPASMTKVMTALVACENMPDWDAAFTMTQDIIDPFYLADATLAGFVHGEPVSMTDLVYGAILPSGAEATEALARVVAGSEEAFTELMNEKAAELGLTGTHFADASGLHNEEHYTTVREMAVILDAALQNEHCRAALSSAYYTSAPTEQNPNGVEMYNKFLCRVASRQPESIDIWAAKTGYTAQAMNCCASSGTAENGREVICVTAHAWTGDFCIEDHLTLYSQYAE